MPICFDATSGVLSTFETVMMRDSVRDDTLEVMHRTDAMTANGDSALLGGHQHLVQRLLFQQRTLAYIGCIIMGARC